MGDGDARAVGIVMLSDNCFKYEDTTVVIIGRAWEGRPSRSG